MGVLSIRKQGVCRIHKLWKRTYSGAVYPFAGLALHVSSHYGFLVIRLGYIKHNFTFYYKNDNILT